MNYFLIGLISIFIFLFVLAIALASKGFVNKFGPEWIPGELGIRFNMASPLIDEWKTIKIFLTPFDADNVLRQIDDYIRTDIINEKAGFEKMRHEKLYTWTMLDTNTFECRNNKTDKLKAVFKLEENMLIYYK